MPPSLGKRELKKKTLKARMPKLSQPLDGDSAHSTEQDSNLSKMQYIFHKSGPKTDLKPAVIPPITPAAAKASHDFEGFETDAMDLDDFTLSPSDPRSPFGFIEHVKNRQTNEFVYLRPVKIAIKFGKPTFNPYNLEIVNYTDLDIKSPDGYYTMSAEVHFL